MTETLPLELLACPVCRHALSPKGDALECEQCKVTYPVGHDVPDLVPADLRAKMVASHPGDGWDRWREAIRGLGEWRARRADRANADALRSDGASDATIRGLFQRAGVRGTVVDVGAKDGARAALLPGDTRYLGVDPFGTRPMRGGTVVRGVAEALPVRDRAADAVISLAAFDYFVDGERAVEEMARVLKPEGVLALLVSTVTSTVARARGGATQQIRMASALRATREVGLLAGLELVATSLVDRERPHTHYYTRVQCTGLLGRKFEIESIEESKQSSSTILYIAAKKKRMSKLPIFREGR